MGGQSRAAVLWAEYAVSLAVARHKARAVSYLSHRHTLSVGVRTQQPLTRRR